ncbi:helix-turn-helix domain-containing protein [Bacteroides sp. 224]|uniref:helix-turn-helix domain-containing protein n=1 Tax=Bacteroides sp. 224 TaxID=2302936 RepID=UPI0013CF87E0|nr:helix-turn-helix domain-containing protein [Bacteroides sp. 224]NDV64634.1 DNA-binding protein [Bacteroides sp. 224]
MFIEKEYFDGWMQRIMERFDILEKQYPPSQGKSRPLLPDGDMLLDNYDLCQMLNVSKRTLQRYRSSGELPFQMIYHKTYYKESDVMHFIETHFSKFRNINKK